MSLSRVLQKIMCVRRLKQEPWPATMLVFNYSPDKRTLMKNILCPFVLEGKPKDSNSFFRPLVDHMKAWDSEPIKIYLVAYSFQKDLNTLPQMKRNRPVGQ